MSCKDCEEYIKWKTPGIDDIPADSDDIYICKIDSYAGWKWEAAVIRDGKFTLQYEYRSINPNYFKLLTRSR